MKDFEVIETTADIGLKVYGCDLRELCINLLRGFYYIVFDKNINFFAYESRGDDYSKISSSTTEELLISLLEDAIFYTYTENTVLYPCEVTENDLKYKLLQNSDYIETEIKAVTRHRFGLVHDKIYTVTVIFGI